MARKKKLSQAEADQVAADIASDPDQALKAQAQKPKRDLSGNAGDIKGHSKFDKFKKGNK